MRKEKNYVAHIHGGCCQCEHLKNQISLLERQCENRSNTKSEVDMQNFTDNDNVRQMEKNPIHNFTGIDSGKI